MDNDNNKNTNLNNDNHSITHILLFICFLINLVTLWFSINTYYMLQDEIDIRDGKVNRTEIVVIEDE